MLFVSHLIDADFSLNVLQALLDDADEGSRGNQSTIDVGLADVTFYTKRKRWVGEPWGAAERRGERMFWTLDDNDILYIIIFPS